MSLGRSRGSGPASHDLERVGIVLYYRCKSLLKAAKRCPSLLVRTVFCDVECVYWCFLGYNHLYGHRHIKLYSAIDKAVAQLIKEIRSDIPGFNS